MAPAGQYGVRYPGYDENDRAPEDHSSLVRRSQSPKPPGWKGSVVRGSLRMEGINYSKYESLRGEVNLQRSLTNGIRDDIISEAGNGTIREDILLRLSPGPIKTVVLDYDSSPRSRLPPSLVDADWCIDVEYVIEARSESAQINIARSLYESLSRGDLQLRATSNAYFRYIDPGNKNDRSIRAVPCTSANPSLGSPSQSNYSPKGYQGESIYSPVGSPTRNTFTNNSNRHYPNSGMEYVRGYSPPRSPTGRLMY